MIRSRARILAIDDETLIHDALRRAFESSSAPDTLAAVEAALFGEEGPTGTASRIPSVEFTCATQGEQGLTLLRKAMAEEKPFDLAIVDMRMPPGWDGLETIEHLWKADASLPVILCTAYSDRSFDEMLAHLGVTDRLLILKKPFDVIEIQQMVLALTRRREVEGKLRDSALYDPVTSLPNRVLASDRITRCIERRRRDGGFNFALLFLDVQGFRLINESLGYDTGDQVLAELGARFSKIVRSLDTVTRPGAGSGMAARLGGDEFIVLLEGVSDASDATMIAQRLVTAARETIRVHDQELHLECRVGIAPGTGDGMTVHSLLRNADSALSAAQKTGGMPCVVFDDSMHERAVRRMRVKAGLDRAMSDGHLRFVWQPIIDLRLGTMRSLEGLLRWHDPELGHVSPVEFIAIAEECGMIESLGLLVIDLACRQLAAWRREVPSLPLVVSVNVSTHQFRAGDLPGRVRDALSRYGVTPDQLALEVTESAMMTEGESAVSQLHALRSAGHAVLLDDFGTGYSSLNHFRHLPISGLKLDRGFLASMDLSGRDAQVIQAIVAMAHAGDVYVVAEGIETQDQLCQLQSVDCDLGQGYLFSKPIEADAVPAFTSRFTMSRAAA